MPFEKGRSTSSASSRLGHFQGRGLGTLLFRFVAGEIASTGDMAYLHACAANTSAISLYETQGFALRSEMNMRMVKRRS